MLSFENDYIAGAHPEILSALVKSNMESLSGYGSDPYTESAISKIRQECSCPDASVYFTVGGTQTNQLVISTLLKDYEGVIASEVGHVSTHEAGAIEYSGHKVITVPAVQGKIQASAVRSLLSDFYSDGNHEHMVFPGMVYISQPTEYGSLYSLDELEALSAVCREFSIPLYVDGARLIYALSASDVTLADMARLSDVFYIGGTKAGCLCGEALVFTKGNMPAHFTALAKQRGALLAKGRLNSIQFDTLFTDDLYLRISSHAYEMRSKLISVLKSAGMQFFYESPTNQQFVIVSNELMEKLSSAVAFSFWEKYDETHTVIRFAVSWSTTNEDIEALSRILQ